MAEPGQPHQSRDDELRRIALWAVPRSVSTAFERIFVERDDAEVLHEPFSHAYYHGPERRHDRFADDEPKDEFAYGAVRDRVMATDGAPIVFLKDMAYQAAPIDDPAFYDAFTNTFLIREPREALTSLHRMWPDFSLEEAGFEAQARLFDLVTRELEQPGLVVDATDFRREPEGVMRSYCDAIGVPYVEDAMSWQSREVEIWRPWAAWHEAAQQSTGIRPPENSAADEALPGHVEAMIEHCQSHYERLHAHRLAP